MQSDSNRICMRRNVAWKERHSFGIAKKLQAGNSDAFFVVKVKTFRFAFADSMTFAYQRRNILGARLAVKKCKVVSLKAPPDRPKRCPRRTLSAVSPRCSSRRSLRERWEPVSRLSKLLSLSLSIARSLSPLRAEQSIRAELEVTTGHRLNQSKPHFISLPPPTRTLPPSLLSLFPFLSLHISRSSRLPGSFSFAVLLSPRLSPSYLFQAWIIHRPRCQGTHRPWRSLVYVRRNW